VVREKKNVVMIMNYHEPRYRSRVKVQGTIHIYIFNSCLCHMHNMGSVFQLHD